ARHNSVRRDDRTVAARPCHGHRGRAAARVRLYEDASGAAGQCAGPVAPRRRQRPLMLAFLLSQIALRLLSALLGGYGIFCLIMSFAIPVEGAKAFLLLSAASAIVYLCGSGGRRAGKANRRMPCKSGAGNVRLRMSHHGEPIIAFSRKRKMQPAASTLASAIKGNLGNRNSGVGQSF